MNDSLRFLSALKPSHTTVHALLSLFFNGSKQRAPPDKYSIGCVGSPFFSWQVRDSIIPRSSSDAAGDKLVSTLDVNTPTFSMFRSSSLASSWSPSRWFFNRRPTTPTVFEFAPPPAAACVARGAAAHRYAAQASGPSALSSHSVPAALGRSTAAATVRVPPPAAAVWGEATTETSTSHRPQQLSRQQRTTNGVEERHH